MTPYRTKVSGFTIVELLITISVLLLMAGLMFSVFGNPLTKASTDTSIGKITNDLRVLDDGINKYINDKTAEPSSLAALVSEGQLKALPIAPSNAKDSAYVGTYAYSIETATNITGSATNDIAIKLTGVTTAVCQGINEKYSDIGSTVPTTVTAGKAVQCYQPSGGDAVALKLAISK